MRRRAFIVSVGGASLWPLAAAAQSVPRIGFLGVGPRGPNFEAFEAGLRALGYVPGKTIEIETRFGDGQANRMAELAKELITLKLDVLVTHGAGVFAARQATTTTPTVVASYGDLVGAGLAETLAHPGGNVTGMTSPLFELVVKQIEMLKQVRPSMTSVGVLLPIGEWWTRYALNYLDSPARDLGVAIVPVYLRQPSDCDGALNAGPTGKIAGIAVADWSPFYLGSGPAEVATAAARHGLPSAGPLLFARNGCLIGYGVEPIPMFYRAATFVDKILKGAKPGDIPIEQATKFETVVNLKTAKALGLEISPTLLASADEVVE
jgi:putative tryptophan/tyrosine transport system substrate-binding protein